MAPFEELQALWQSQSAYEPPRFDAVAAAGAFRRYGRKQDTINSIKAVLMGLVMVQVVITCRHRPVLMFVCCVILFSAVMALIAEWRNQRAIARFDFSAPSVAFVRNAIGRLQRQRNPFHTREFAILFGSVSIGYNVMVFASYSKWNLTQRLIGHSFAIFLPAAIYAFGRLVRARRWEAECRPLMDRLSLLLHTLEEPAR